ncbi:hypothetical protein [Candidatus Finniella inopinata]|uniref:Uncharacterized protein n=1 Tax=Candidatus Finniella inopinata TaxID=1696036 RepID=A0A4Q7DL58_9PROT|nr:hypothetical protein [Candidatus Finniella inopinata]RZI47079.1 hypothetical protein EQU50_00385 [Candidatus Finniella inopinata]
MIFSQGYLVELTKRFVTIDEFSPDWNPVTRCAQKSRDLAAEVGYVEVERLGGCRFFWDCQVGPK